MVFQFFCLKCFLFEGELSCMCQNTAPGLQNCKNQTKINKLKNTKIQKTKTKQNWKEDKKPLTNLHLFWKENLSFKCFEHDHNSVKKTVGFRDLHNKIKPCKHSMTFWRLPHECRLPTCLQQLQPSEILALVSLFGIC